MDLVLDKPIAANPAFAEQMARARGLLRKSRPAAGHGPAVLAALLFATSSILFVGVMITAPAAPAVLTHPAH